MSNVVYKGKEQVPLYRIYRHSITPWAPGEVEEQHLSLGTAALLPGTALSRGLGSQGHPQPALTSASASAQFPFSAPPQLLIKSPMS